VLVEALNHGQGDLMRVGAVKAYRYFHGPVSQMQGQILALPNASKPRKRLGNGAPARDPELRSVDCDTAGAILFLFCYCRVVPNGPILLRP
jgi:hypothetical protein